MNLARSTWLVRMALLGGLAAYAATPAVAGTALVAAGDGAKGISGGGKGGGGNSSAGGGGKSSGGGLPTSGGKGGGSSGGAPISGGVGKPASPPATPPVHAPAPRPTPSATPRTIPVTAPKQTPSRTTPSAPNSPTAPSVPKVGTKAPPPTTFPTREVKAPASRTLPSVDAPRSSQPSRTRLETRPTKQPAATTSPDATPDRSRPISERLREARPGSLPKVTFPSRTIDPPAAGKDRDLVATRPNGRSPRLEQQLNPLPRLPRATLPADTIAPNHGATASNGSALSASFDVASASHCHDNVDCNYWWNDPCNRHCTWVDSCGISYGYLFCGSSLWWYSWYPGCAPCYRPYYYYWGASCWWAPAYYPSYSTVYVVHDDYYVPPSYGDAAAAPAAPAVDGAQLLADGWTAFLAGRYTDAVESFRQSVLASPDDPFAKLALAQGFFALGNYADAAFLYRRAAELLTDWPLLGDDPRARYSDPADHFEQLLALRSFLERVPGEPAATLVLAVQSWFSGDLAVARDAFAELHALDPSDPLVAPFALKLGFATVPPPAGGR